VIGSDNLKPTMAEKLFRVLIGFSVNQSSALVRNLLLMVKALRFRRISVGFETSIKCQIKMTNLCVS